MLRPGKVTRTRDGRKLAFARVSSMGSDTLFVVDLDAELRPSGQPRPVTTDTWEKRDPAWLASDRELVFTSSRNGYYSLWQVPASGGAEPQLLGGENAIEPAVDFTGRRIVYTRINLMDRLNRIRLDGSGLAAGPVTPIRSVEKQAHNPAWSPAGDSIAYESLSSGHSEIRVCGRDGSNSRQLTNFGGPVTGTPRWSPDSRRLVFDSRVDGRGKIFMMDTAGGSPVQFTSGSAEDVVPSWSRDGKWVYFASNRSGTFQVWKAPLNGGPPGDERAHEREQRDREPHETTACPRADSPRRCSSAGPSSFRSASWPGSSAGRIPAPLRARREYAVPRAKWKFGLSGSSRAPFSSGSTASALRPESSRLRPRPR
jgi:Tol biopolymer transport system component